MNLNRSPLLVPRDFSAGFIPELLDLDQLFLDTAFRVDPSGERLARLLAFPSSHGDAIVLDDVDGHPLDLLFDDALVGDTIASIPDGLGESFGLGPIGGSVPLGNRVRFDDFPGVGTSPAAGRFPSLPRACCSRSVSARSRSVVGASAAVAGLRGPGYLHPIGW